MKLTRTVPPEAMAVDRCICLSYSFRHLLSLQAQHGWGFDRLVKETGCATGCGLCAPYVRMALRTGEPSFELMTDYQVREFRGDLPVPDRTVPIERTARSSGG